MTIQELINELQHAVDKLGFDSDATVLIDTIDNNYGVVHQGSDICLDNDSSCMQLISINLYKEKS
tara:strand:+ start:319 stop:513 length:195 start_codon:yes stop_codon:yes gene_type:complete